MSLYGRPLTKLPSRGRTMFYKLPNCETVPARSCNDHILISVAVEPTADAPLNIEGTDWLSIVMPEVERTDGRIIGYLVPTEEAAEKARQRQRVTVKQSEHQGRKHNMESPVRS